MADYDNGGFDDLDDLDTIMKDLEGGSSSSQTSYGQSPGSSGSVNDYSGSDLGYREYSYDDDDFESEYRSRRSSGKSRRSASKGRTDAAKESAQGRTSAGGEETGAGRRKSQDSGRSRGKSGSSSRKSKSSSAQRRQISTQRSRSRFMHSLMPIIVIILIAIAVVVCIAVFMKLRGNGSDEATGTGSASTESSESLGAADEGLGDLLSQYYVSYRNGNTSDITTYAYPMTPAEKSYIQMLSQYIETYENITCYTTEGVSSGEYCVAVALDVDYLNINTAMSDADYFYVRTDANGNLYIDNAYSEFNLTYNQLETDQAIIDAMNAYKESDVGTSLSGNVEMRYDNEINGDADLKTFVETTLPTLISEWQATVDFSVLDDTQTTEGETTETTEGGESTETTTQTLYTTDQVRLRSSASTDGEILAEVPSGTAVTALGTEGDWTQVEYNGTQGYMSSAYLSSEGETSGTDTSGAQAGEAGSTASVSEEVNIRASASTDAEIVGSAVPGDTITIGSVEGDWTQVTVNGVSGYIYSSLLSYN